VVIFSGTSNADGFVFVVFLPLFSIRSFIFLQSNFVFLLAPQILCYLF